MTTILTSGGNSTISSLAQFNDVITQAAFLAADSGVYEIHLAANGTIDLNSGDGLLAFNLRGGVQIVVKGNGATLDGHTNSHGLIVYGGNVTFENLTVANTVAQGGDGIGSAGAGAGLGGGLFVANNSGVPGDVTLSNVEFVNTKAEGGLTAFIRNTDSRASTGGGGGLFGGTGGYPEAYDGNIMHGNANDTGHGGAGGGGGFGGHGGSFTGAGEAGLVPNAPGGSAGGSASPGGGANGGGGGAGVSINQQFGSPGGGGGIGANPPGPNSVNPNNGKDGGYGGGGGGSSGFPNSFGGNGGFGGGGGGGSILAGGHGGFGGGGGAGASVGNRGGFGGGDATDAVGGGGLAAGGVIFVQGGARVTFVGSADVAAGTLEAGDVFGVGVGPTNNGQQFANGIYLQSLSASLVFNTEDPTTHSATSQSVAGVIGDDYGSAQAAGYDYSGTGYTPGHGGVEKYGAGTLTLSAVNTYVGATNVNAGTLIVDGSIAGSAVGVQSGATLGGHGTTGAVVIYAGGKLAPGNSPGIIHTGDLTFAAGAHFAVEIAGTTAGSGYDQVVVNGAVSLGNASLDLTFLNGFASHGGDSFLLIDNDGNDAVTGQFLQGSTFTSGGKSYSIDYSGGDGNDVVLTEVLPMNKAPTFTTVSMTASFAIAGPGGQNQHGRFGAVVTGIADINGDGVRDLVVTAPEYGGTSSFAISGTTAGIGQVQILSGATGAALLAFNGFEQSQNLGYSIAAGDDYNNDGVPDLIVGLPGYSAPRGAVIIYSSIQFDAPYSGGTEFFQHDAIGTNEGTTEFLGDSVANIGDLDGDGYDDIIVGAAHANTSGGTGSGYAIVYSGKPPANQLLTVLNRIDGDNTLVASGNNAWFGTSVAGLGDINGDGYGDVIVGGAHPGGSSGYFQVISGDWILHNTGTKVLYQGLGGAANGGDRLGYSVANAGDVNNDGVNDFIVGAPGGYATHTGYARVYSGANGAVLATLNGRGQNQDQFGVSVAGVGDVNGDGYDDVMVGTETGYVQIYSGKDWSVFFDLSVNGGTNTRVGAAGDINGDGLPDVLIGSPSANGSVGAALLYVTQTTSTLNNTPTFVEGGSPVVLDSSISIRDEELGALNSGNGNYSGASVAVARHTAANSEDHFGFSLTGSPTFSVSGNTLIAGGNAVATATQTGNGTLTIAFTDANGTIPTQAIVNDILSRITYSNSSDAPPASVQLDFTFNDGNSGAQGAGGPGSETQSITVGITATNDAPVNAVPSSVTAGDNGIVTFSADLKTSLAVADIDSSTLTTTLDVAHGTLALGSTAGLTSVTGNGTGHVVVSGSQAAINSALSGLSYHATPGFGGSDALTLSTSDGQLADTDVIAIDDRAAVAHGYTKAGSEILVNTATFGEESTQQITALSNGGFVVTWQDNSLGIDGAGGDNSSYAVKAQVFAAGGAPVGGEILVNTATANFQANPEITALSNGGFVVTWRDYSQGVGGAGGDASGLALKAQVFSVGGTPVGSEILVNTATTGHQGNQQITALSNGGFVVTWIDFSKGWDDGVEPFEYGVKAQVFAAGGAPVGGEILVNTATLSEEIFPQITALSNGGFVVTWQDYSQGVGGAGGDTSSVAVKAQVFAAGGTPVGGEILVNTATQDGQLGPQITALSNGGFVVTWHDGSQGVGGAGGDANGYAVKAQVFAAGGTQVGSEILVNTATAGDQLAPQITALSNGGFVVTWYDYSQGLFGAGGAINPSTVKAQVFAAGGAPVGGEIMVSTAVPDSQNSTQITALSNGGFVVTWQDYSQGVGGAGGDTSSSAVKAQVFAADGTPVGSEILVNTATEGEQFSPQITALSNGGFVVTWTDTSHLLGDGGGGDLYSSAVKAQVFALNQAPVNDVPGAQSVNEDTNLLFNGAGGNTISIADADGASGNPTVTLSVAHGALTLGSLAGLIFTAGDGVADAAMTFTGTVSDINAALYELTYRAASNYNGADTLTVTTNDNETSAGSPQIAVNTIAITVNAVNDAPVVDTAGAALSYSENGLAAAIAPSATVTDTDSTNFNGGSLTVSFTANGSAADQLTIGNQGTAAGQISVSLGSVFYGGVAIGSFTGGSNGSALVISFNSAAATPAAVQALQRDILYSNSSDNPSTATRTVTFTMVDGDGTASGGADTGSATATIAVNAVNDAPSIGAFKSTHTVTLVSTNAAGEQADGSVSTPVFSPDGSKIAFISQATNLVAGDTNGEYDVFVKDLATGAVTCVSADAGGVQGNGRSLKAAFSPDGSTIAFYSEASNLVAGDTNGARDIFVKNLVTGAVTRISVDGGGAQGNGDSVMPVFSPDGSKIAFWSYASNLVPGDTNGVDDLFVKDLATGAITRVSVDAGGAQGNAGSITPQTPVFSPDGSKIAFVSAASNLVAGDTNDRTDIFVKDLSTGAITRVSVDAAGAEADNYSFNPVFSPDGSKIAFNSWASNLVPGDTNGQYDVFVKDLATGAITRVSTGDGGVQGNVGSFNPVFSPDGKKIVFDSTSSTLVPGDTNGFTDLFIKDLITGALSRVSVDGAGAQADFGSLGAVFSPDGRTIAFDSSATNLVAGDNNLSGDVFIRNLNPDPQDPAAYVENAAPVRVNTAPVTISDPDNSNFNGGSLTAALTAGSHAGDSLTLIASVTPGSGIELSGSTVSYNGTVIGTLSGGGTASLSVALNANADAAAVAALAGAIGFSTSGNAPSADTRTVTFTLVDGAGGNDTGSFTQTVQVTPVNDAPTASNLTQTLTVAEDATPPKLFTVAPVVADIDSTSVTATLTLSNPAAGVLVGFGTGVAGVYTISGALASVNAALAAVTFDSAQNFNGTLDVAVTINDGVNEGPQGTNPSGTVSITVTPVNDEPTLTATAANPAYVEGNSPATLFSGAAASTIEAGQTITSMTLTVSGLANGANELLRIDGSNVALVNGNSLVTATNGLTINISVTGSTATATFTGANLSEGALQTLVNTLGYSVAGDTPTAANRLVRITEIRDSGSNTAPDDNTTALNIASAVSVTAVNDAPTVSRPAGANVSATRGQTLQVSSLFAGSDPEGDALTYYLYDGNSAANSGHFVVGGNIVAAGTIYALTAAQFAQATFVAGTAGAGISDSIYVQAFDGAAYSGWNASVNVTVPANRAPTVGTPAGTGLSPTSGQALQVSSLFGATDPDGDTLTYYVYDANAAANSGRFMLDGVALASGSIVPLTAAQLARTTFVTGAAGTVDDIYVQAYDGIAYSGWNASVHVAIPAGINHAPTVSLPSGASVAPTSGQTIQLSSLFGGNDVDGNTLTYYVYDASPAANSGSVKIGGNTVAAQTITAMTAAQFAQATFVAGAAGTVDDIYVQVFDGAVYSGWNASVHVAVPAGANHAPTVGLPSGAGVTTTVGQTIQLSSLFSGNDVDGNTLTYYVYDASAAANSGNVKIGSTTVAAGVITPMTAAQFAQATFVAGAAGTADDIFVQTFDGQLYSGWNAGVHIDVPVTNHAPTVGLPSGASVAPTSGQSIQLSSLFSGSDVDGNALTYYVYDNNGAANSGHFVVGGNVVAAQTITPMTVAQLATATFVAGAAGSVDDIFVQAFDGQLYSGWNASVHVAVPAGANNAPTVDRPSGNSANPTAGQTLQMSTLFSGSDVDGNTLTYFVYDNNNVANSGHVVIDGNVVAAQTITPMTAAQLATATFVAGDAGTQDDIFVQAFDGQLYSGWASGVHLFV